MTPNPREQLEKLDKQLIVLLEQRVSAYTKLLDDEEEVGKIDAELEEGWQDESDELGWNISAALKVVRSINDLCKSAGE